MGHPVIDVPFLDRHGIERRAEDFLRAIPGWDSSWDAAEISRNSGVRVSYEAFDDPEVSGMLVRRSGEALIRVRKNDPYVRQNFTVAHELGHYVLHPTGSWTDTTRTMYRRDCWLRDSTDRRAEYQANLFAAALLMPEKVVRERWALLNSPSYLAPSFRVSKRAVFRRLEELGLIVPSVEGFQYLDITSLLGTGTAPDPSPLTDDAGEVPTFPPVAVDERGRIIPMSREEREARQAALDRVLTVAGQAGWIDPPELLE